ncbi:SPOSA6832_04708, partial [Sporobolomyces salmonicolor]
MNGFSPAPASAAEPASATAPPSHHHPKLDLPPASSSLPTPPTTSIEQPSSPPLSQPEAYPASIAPVAIAEQQQQQPQPPLSAIPSPPVVSLPSHLDLPAPLAHQDSASSLAVEPPTPVPSGALPPPPPAPAPAPSAAPHDSTTPTEPPHLNGANGLEAPEVPAGLGMGAHGQGHAQQSAVEVLADVAMGEAALGLADFAAGAGSADVNEEGAVAMSPPLKRSAPESDGISGAINGMFVGSIAEEEREAKRPRVDEMPAEVCCPSFVLSEPETNLLTLVKPPRCGSRSLLLLRRTRCRQHPLLHHLPPHLHLPPPSLRPPSRSSNPLWPRLPLPSLLPPRWPLPPWSPPIRRYRARARCPPPPYKAMTPPALSPPAPAPPAAAASTISPSDLHHLPSASPLAVPPRAHTPSASPLPSPAMPIPAPAVGAAPTPSPTYASPDAFAAQVQPQQPQYAPQHQQPYPPVASTSHQPPPQPAAPAPPPAAPIAVMTKEQQKHAINLVRNLKRNKNAPPFLKPVDHVALLIPDYYKIIVNPMDLGTIETKLQATGKAMTLSQKAGRVYGLDYSYGQQPGALWEGQQPDGVEPKSYRTVHEFKEDLDRIWENCFRYNGPREKNPVSAMAGIMQDAADKAYRAMPFAPAVDPYPPRHASPEIKREPRPAPGFVPAIRRSEDGSSRPKREIHAPAKDLPYLESAGVDPVTGGPLAHGGKSRNGRISSKGAQEQLRFCKEVVKELFKKVHEPYAYPFYQPVADVAAYPTYLEYVKRPMDLSTIRSKLEHNQYPVPPYQAFEHDVRLIFKNCYAFNPPGTVVNDWGHKLESVFERKWEERPTGEDDDLSDDDGLTAMEQQLQALAANIEMMRQSKKKEKEAKRLASIPARPAPKPAKKPSQQAVAHNPYAMPPRQPVGGGGAHKKAGGRPSGGGGGGAPKKKKRRDDDSDDYYEDDGGAYYGGSGGASSSRRHAPQPSEEFVDFEMKRELAVKIVSFEGEQLEEAINIIRRGRPDLLGDANKEIELDIDQLDQRTLLALYRYVCPDSRPALAPSAARAPKAPKGGAKAPRNQRKNLDEEKESERIEALEARLREFDQTSGAGTPAAAGGDLGSRRGSEVGLAAGAGGEEGDQASSDSSDEASSDSESEDEE